MEDREIRLENAHFSIDTKVGKFVPKTDKGRQFLNDITVLALSEMCGENTEWSPSLMLDKKQKEELEERVKNFFK